MLETLGSNKNKLEILQWKIFLQSAQTQIRLEGAEMIESIVFGFHIPEIEYF